MPIDHHAYPIKQSYRPSSLLTIEPINLSSSFETFKPFGLFSSNLNILEPKKPKLGKEKVWDLTPYRNEEIQTLRKLGVQIEYLILPDTEMSWSANSIIHDMLQGPLFKDGGVAGITFYLLISTCNSNVFYFFQAKMPPTMFNAAGKNPI